MRALAHVPLLSMAAPRRVLVIGFGVGNTVARGHAAPVGRARRRRRAVARTCWRTPTTSATRTDDVLHDPKVAVYLNDGRQHLQMAAPGSLRSGHARAAADRARRRGGAVLARVLPPGAIAPHGRRLREPVAAGVSGAGREQPGDGARVSRRVPAGGAAVGHAGRAAARRDRRGRGSRSIPIGLRQALDARTGRARRPRPARPRPARARSSGAFVGSAATLARRHARVAAGHRRPADPGVRRVVGAVDRAARRAGRALRSRARSRRGARAASRAGARCRRWPGSTPTSGCCARRTTPRVAAVAAAARGRGRAPTSSAAATSGSCCRTPPRCTTSSAPAERGQGRVERCRRARSRPRCGSSPRRRRRGRTSARSGTSRGARCSRRGASATRRPNCARPSRSCRRRPRRTTISAWRSRR